MLKMGRFGVGVKSVRGMTKVEASPSDCSALLLLINFDYDLYFGISVFLLKHEKMNSFEQINMVSASMLSMNK